MSPRKAGYRRLPGFRQGILHGASLWLAEDHLLAVESWRFREEYRRFYLKDIQSLTVTRGRSFAVPAWQVWLLLVLLLFAVMMVRLFPDALWMWLAAAVALCFYRVAVALNGGCRVTLRTAVSTVTLKSLHRVRAARKFLAILEPEIARVQGTLPEDWTAREVPVPLAATVSPAAPPAEPAPPAASPLWSAVPAVLMTLSLAAVGTCAFLDLRAPSPTLQTSQAAVSFLAALAGIWLLIGRLQHKAPTSFAVVGMAAVVLVGMLAWGEQVLPVMEVTLSRKIPAPATLSRTASYRWLQVLTVVLSIISACVMGLLTIWKRPEERS